MNNLIPKPTFYNQVKQHLIKKWYKKTGRIPELPWMSQKEQDVLLEAIATLKPQKCLEWGAGFSTVFFTKYLEPTSTWLSIEHNKEWYDLMHSKDLPKGVGLTHIAQDNPDYEIKISDGTYEDFKAYVEHPKGKFDFILIDGRARSACLRKAFELVNDNGLVVMHDANRDIYHENFHLFKHQYNFRDQRKSYGGIWLGSKAKKINTIIDVDLHQSLWNKHLKLLQLIRPGYKMPT